MLENIWLNIQYGIHHILDIKTYDHILFLIVLTVPYVFKNWIRVLWLVSIFTLGHTLSLILAVYNIVNVKTSLIAFLIPVTILIMAIFNIFTAGKGPQKNTVGILFICSLFYGLIHGLSFVRDFKIWAGNSHNKLILLTEFSLGIELGQLIIAFLVLFLGYLIQILFRFSKRDWVMVISAVVIGFVIPMLLEKNYLI